MTHTTHSPSETQSLAATLAANAAPGAIFCLSGDLGAGKTAFAQGFARGLGVTADVSSPTFAIINEYNCGRLPLYHFDVYRIKSILEMEDTGYEEYFYGAGVCLIEWAELVEPLIPPNAIWVLISKCQSGENVRIITIEGGGS